jgi:hypothetical protein
VVAPANASIRAHVTLEDVEIAQNTNFGLSVTAGGGVTVRNSTINDNGFISALANIRVDGTGGAATIDLDNVMVSGSATGIIAVNSGIVRVNNSSIIGNTTGLSTSGGNIQSFGNNRLTGNGFNGSFTGTITLQ